MTGRECDLGGKVKGANEVGLRGAVANVELKNILEVFRRTVKT